MELRKATINDMNDVLEISKDIWDGDDYIGDIFEDWVNDIGGEFTVALDNEKVIAFSKMTMFSKEIVWFEGLRVHKDYRGRKISSLLSDYQIEKAKLLGFKKIRLSTHCHNESVTLIENRDFKKIDVFKFLYLEVGDIASGKKYNKLVKLDEKISDEFFPLGWEFYENKKELMDILLERGDIYSLNESKFIVSNYKSVSNEMSLIILSGEDYKDIVIAANNIAIKNKSKSISVMTQSDVMTETLKNNNFVEICDVKRDVYLYEKEI